MYSADDASVLAAIRGRETAGSLARALWVSKNAARAWLSGRARMPERFLRHMAEVYRMRPGKPLPAGSRIIVGIRRDGGHMLGRRVELEEV